MQYPLGIFKNWDTWRKKDNKKRVSNKIGSHEAQQMYTIIFVYYKMYSTCVHNVIITRVQVYTTVYHKHVKKKTLD